MLKDSRSLDRHSQDLVPFLHRCPRIVLPSQECSLPLRYRANSSRDAPTSGRKPPRKPEPRLRPRYPPRRTHKVWSEEFPHEIAPCYPRSLVLERTGDGTYRRVGVYSEPRGVDCPSLLRTAGAQESLRLV
jgi:hypothetical protein